MSGVIPTVGGPDCGIGWLQRDGLAGGGPYVFKPSAMYSLDERLIGHVSLIGSLLEAQDHGLRTLLHFLR